MKKLNDFLAGGPMTAAAGICLALSLVSMLTGIRFPVDPAWLTILISGIPMLYLALTRLFRQKWVSSALLISIAMLASMAIGEIFAAGEVAFIMAVGAILEDMTVARAKKGLSGLIALAPVCGRKIVREGDAWREEEIPAEQIRIGDLLRVLPGEKLPVDGVIVSGRTAIDQSVMTGESLPVEKEEGQEVYCGTLNCSGSIDIRASRVGEDSSLQRLIAMVKAAEEKKAPVQRVTDKWAIWLVPIALLIAVGTIFITRAAGLPLMTAMNRGVTVLVVFCPCALALAAPTTIIAAIGQATKHGVIIKSGEALERMGAVDTIAFDKTGTLTCGKLQVCGCRSFAPDMDAEEVLALAACAEAKSEHPLGRAIVRCARERELPVPECEDFQMAAGMGVKAVAMGKCLNCGSERYWKEEGLLLTEEIQTVLSELRREGKAAVLLAVNGQTAGVIALSDSIREGAREMTEELSKMDTETVLLTGDNELTAAYFSKKAGITKVYAGLLPEQKVEHIARLREEGACVCMIGDGVNDAPALKTADVGVAMGSMGSDVAIEAADIALMGDDISKIPYLKRLSRSAIRTIKGNIAASMCINAAAIVLSVTGMLNPVTGALVHNAGSVLVVLNAALLYV